MTDSPLNARWASVMPLLAVVLITGLIFTPILIDWQNKGDFVPHADYTARMIAGDGNAFLEVPNFLYHVSVGIPSALFPSVALSTWSVLVSLAYYVALAVSVWGCLRPVQPQPSPRWTIGTVALSVALLVLAPIFFFTPTNTYFGYFAPYVYHNPTMIPLRPLSLGVFVASVVALQSPPRFVWWRILLVAALTLGSLLAKPSFILAFVPALVPVVGWAIIRRWRVDWWTLLGGVFLPAIGLLGFQALTYAGGSIAFYPLHTLDLWTLHYDPTANQQILLKLVLSALFPLVVYLVYSRDALKSVWLNVAWLGFMASLGQAYLFIDTGEPPAGNLMWNVQITLLVLMVASAVFAWQRTQRNGRNALVWGVFGAHVVAGVVWYVAHYGADYVGLIYGMW